MKEEILKPIRDNIANIKTQLAEAKELIAILKSAGEDTITIENNFRELERRLIRWETALKSAK